MARPTKLTPETQTRIVQAIQLGSTYELAAQYGGIAYNTFNEWMKAGEAAQSGRFREFYEAIKAAEGRAAVQWLAKIEAATNDGAWQAAAWKLERRYPNDYGRTVNEHTGPGGQPLPPAIQINAIDYRAATAALTTGPILDRAPSGEGESLIDGETMGQDNYGRRRLLGDSESGG